MSKWWDEIKWTCWPINAMYIAWLRSKTRRYWRALKTAHFTFRIQAQGTYLHSGWNGRMEYHLYAYRGQEYHLPRLPPPCNHYPYQWVEKDLNTRRPSWE